MRTRNPITVLGPDGKPLAGASVHTTLRSTGADASVYSKETGAEPGTNPVTTDSKGRCVQWLDRGAYNSTVTAEGMEPYVEAWDSAPAGDGAVDTTWVGDGQIKEADLENEAVTNGKVKAGVLKGDRLLAGDVAADRLEGAVLEALGLNAGATKRRGHMSIATEQSRENTAYGTLATPDEVTVELAENGIITVYFQAIWKETVAGNASAAIFLNETPLKAGYPGIASPLEPAATIGGTGLANKFVPLVSAAGWGLVSNQGLKVGEAAYVGDATTGQIIGGGAVLETPRELVVGGPVHIFAAAGIYKVSVRYKALSGSVIVKGRRLWVRTEAF